MTIAKENLKETFKGTLNLAAFFRGVVEGLYFAESGTDDDGETVEDLGDYVLSPNAKNVLWDECKRFLILADPLIQRAMAISGEYSYHQAGIDFWLTRQGHGAGYWDRDLDDVGEALTALARTFSNRCIFLTSDNLLEVE